MAFFGRERRGGEGVGGREEGAGGVYHALSLV